MTVFLHVLLLSAKPVECASWSIKMPGHYVSFSVQYCCFSRDVTAAMLVSEEQKHFSPLETKLHFHLNSPNYVNCIVLKARALTFLRFWTESIELPFKLDIAGCCRWFPVFFTLLWMSSTGNHLTKGWKSRRMYNK